MEVPQITPEPDEAERKAIFAALAADEAERSKAFRRAESLAPLHGPDGDEP